MSIRPANPDDAVVIAEIHTASWRVAYRGIMPDRVLDELSVEESALRWRTRLSAPPHGTLVAEHAGALVGFATFGPTRDQDAAPATGELQAIYLLPEVWRCGFGNELWSAARAVLASDGFIEATVWVLEENARARGFYERLGFTLDSEATKVSERGGASLVQIRYRARIA